jgi:hypothetical protein
MENTIFYLIGPPGVGKYTVGRIIATRSGAKLVDNHYWNNVVFGLIEQDGVTPPASIRVEPDRACAPGGAGHDRDAVAAVMELHLHPCRTADRIIAAAQVRVRGG